MGVSPWLVLVKSAESQAGARAGRSRVGSLTEA